MSPERLIDGTKAVLTKSTTAVRDDLLIMNDAGGIVGRMQLKDTVPSISKTVNQVKAGKYAGTQLMGTPETVAAYNQAVAKAAEKGVNVTQKMSGTGVSSADTARIASKTIGNAAGKITPQAMGSLAASSGAVGAAISGGVEVISSGIKLANGEIDGGEFVGNVAKETVGGGLSAAGGSLAATAAAVLIRIALTFPKADWSALRAGILSLLVCACRLV